MNVQVQGIGTYMYLVSQNTKKFLLFCKKRDGGSFHLVYHNIVHIQLQLNGMAVKDRTQSVNSE